MSPCKFSEFCGLDASPNAGEYCILHYPVASKNKEQFWGVVKQFLDSGRSDFRRVQFLTGEWTFFREVTFSDVLDLRDAIFPHGLNLVKAILPHGLLVKTDEIQHIHLQEAEISGLVDIAVKGKLHTLQAHGATFNNDVKLSCQEADNLILGATFRGRTTIRGGRVRTITFRGGTINGTLDLRECTFGHFSELTVAKFGPSAEVDLGGTVIESGGLVIGGSCGLRVLRLNATTIHGMTSLSARMGEPRIRIIAAEQAPQFDREDRAVLTNVDLSECRLLGNNLERFELSNVRWGHRSGRDMFRDEIALLDGNPQQFPISNLRESYQLLKQRYQERGDHVRSGDFHYGEMEMKRRGFPWWKKVWSWEFGYWLLSGYGMRPGRPFFWLVVLVFFPALFYWLGNQVIFTQGLSHYLLFSLQVAALQRPPTPASFTEGARLVQTIQMILSPILIALFALAVRMRVKR